MKIIAKSSGGYLLDISSYELEKLIGNYYSPKKYDEIKIGAEVDVSEMFDQIRVLKDHSKSINSIQDECQKILSSIKRIKPLSKPIIEEIKE